MTPVPEPSPVPPQRPIHDLCATKSFTLVTGPDEMLCMQRFQWGHQFLFRNQMPGTDEPVSELEYFGWGGAGYQPIVTMITAPGANYLQIRCPDDRNSLIIGYQLGRMPYIATEFPNTQLGLAPNGDLDLRPQNGGQILIHGKPLDDYITQKVLEITQRASAGDHAAPLLILPNASPSAHLTPCATTPTPTKPTPTP